MAAEAETLTTTAIQMQVAAVMMARVRGERPIVPP
jgi:hypothetical protein